MKKSILTLALLAALFKANAQEIDSIKVNTKEVTPAVQVDNFSGNIEFIAGSNKSSYNTYVRPNTFYNLPGNISGYNWVEFYTDGTFCGRNTLSKTIIGKLGLENQLLYISKVPVSTGIGIDYTFTPTENILIKPYFTPFLVNSKGKIVKNTSITGIYFSAKITPKITVSGFGEMNFSAKIDDKLNPEWSYGEFCANYAVTSHSSIEYVPSLTNKGSGVAAPKVNHRIGYVYTF